jgi:hypothetical protein
MNDEHDEYDKHDDHGDHEEHDEHDEHDWHEVKEKSMILIRTMSNIISMMVEYDQRDPHCW